MANNDTVDPVEDNLFLNKMGLSLGSLHVCIHTCTHGHMSVWSAQRLVVDSLVRSWLALLWSCALRSSTHISKTRSPLHPPHTLDREWRLWELTGPGAVQVGALEMPSQGYCVCLILKVLDPHSITQ